MGGISVDTLTVGPLLDGLVGAAVGYKMHISMFPNMTTTINSLPPPPKMPSFQSFTNAIPLPPPFNPRSAIIYGSVAARFQMHTVHTHSKWDTNSNYSSSDGSDSELIIHERNNNSLLTLEMKDSEFKLSESIVDINATKVLVNKAEFIQCEEILSLLNSNDSNYIIIDVRQENDDYIGGHIANSIRIPNQIFYNKIPEMMEKYNQKSIFILQCMYGARRSVECMEFYAKAISEVIANYSKKDETSYFIMYTSKVDTDNIKSKTKFAAMDDMNNSTYIDKKTIYIKCNELMYHNLCNQKLYVVKDGFFGFINNTNVDQTNTNIIAQFDMNEWQELSVLNETKLYHKNEFFSSDGQALKKVLYLFCSFVIGTIITLIIILTTEQRNTNNSTNNSTNQPTHTQQNSYNNQNGGQNNNGAISQSQTEMNTAENGVTFWIFDVIFPILEAYLHCYIHILQYH